MWVWRTRTLVMGQCSKNYRERLTHTHTHTHTRTLTFTLPLLLSPVRRKENSPNFIQHGRTPNVSLHRGTNGHKVQSFKVVFSVHQISFIYTVSLKPAALTAIR